MTAYLIKRLLLMIPTLCGILIISFLVIKMAPGDPAGQKFGGAGQAAAGMNSERGTEAAEKRFREKYHFDDSLPVQFGYFLKRLFTLDLISFQQERPILPELKEHLKVTLSINLIVFFLIYLFAVPLGIFSASFPHSPADRVTTVALFVLYSLPSFWVAVMLQMAFLDKSQTIWFPVSGLESIDAEKFTFGERLFDWAHHVTLPIICLTYGGLAYISRQMRAGMLEVIRQDYIRTAEAKGARRARVIFVHALRNGLFPIITLFASLLPFLIGGSVIIEYIFNIPGMGKYAYDAVMSREYDIVMATLIMSAVMTLLGILLSDIMYVVANPRVTFENRS
jgi:peptide/nickel transport system permease protein